MTEESEPKRGTVLQAVELALRDLQPYLQAREITIENHPELADAIALAITLKALVDVLSGTAPHIPAEVAFDQTTASIVTNKVASAVPAWDIYSDLQSKLSHLAQEHAVYLDSLRPREVPLEETGIQSLR